MSRLNRAAPKPQLFEDSTGQAAASRRNRQLQERQLISRALQSLGRYAEWPDFVQKFYTDAGQRIDFEQSASPCAFEAPPFDRLKQSPAEWAKIANEAWARHRDNFLQECAFWPRVGVDEEIPVAKSQRSPRAASVKLRQGNNTPAQERYLWAAKYLLHTPIKEIAAQHAADPSTVGRVARTILRKANWYHR